MKTRAGIKLTKHEASCVRALRRLAKKWDEEDNRLWLFSASGHLNVMMDGGDEEQSHFGFTKGNPHPAYTAGGGIGGGRVNQENYVEEIDIPNDGGDW